MIEIKHRWGVAVLLRVDNDALSGANLSEANLSEANLGGANLSEADLFQANLCGANLFGANLFRANLSRANLRGVDLFRANLSEANLSEADLTGAYLTDANLSEANLRGANLTGAYLARAYLTDANLSGTILDPGAGMEYPTRTNARRAGFEIEGQDGEYLVGWRTRHSTNYGSTDYAPGTIHRAPWFSVDQSTACHPGLYLWPTREQAEEWELVPGGGDGVVRVACLRRETMEAGGKWRTKRLLVLPEGDA